MKVGKTGCFCQKRFPKSLETARIIVGTYFINELRLILNKMITKYIFQVSLVDAFETEKMCLLKFDSLPGTDVVTYLAEKPIYTEQMVADITCQILDALDYIQWRGRVYLNLEPVNVLVSSGRSLGKTVQVKLANFETTQTVAKTGTQIKGTYNFDYAGK